MAGYSAIADAGDALVELLRDRMGDLVDDDEVALASPGEVGPGNDLRLTLYLYRVTESEHLKNAEREAVDGATDREPPLALDLYYLFTAHPSTGGNDETARTREQHSVLGRAMQVVRDTPVLRGSDLSGSLDEEVRITLHSEPVDDVVTIWGTFGEEPFRPSVSYLVTPVIIESTREEVVQRVVERELTGYSWQSRAIDDE